MEAAEVLPGAAPRILASERQVTRLGASVFRTGRITQESTDMICGVLGGMAATYRKLNIDGIRAVATAAVRDAGNQHEFIARTSAALGTDVEIISGQEEARLIHLGVKSRWPHPKERFLIIDIGGGSAEIILSDQEQIGQAFSKPLGALRLQELAPRQAYLIYVTQKGLWLKDLDLTAYLRFNPGDNSRLAWFELRHHWPSFDLTFQLQQNMGRSTSEFGIMPDQRDLPFF